MNYEQQSAIQKALLDEINNQYDVLDEQLLALAFTSAIETQRRIVELDTLREYVLDLDPESATPDNEPENVVPVSEGMSAGSILGRITAAPAPEKTDEQIVADAKIEREAILADLAFLETLGFVRVG